MVKKSKKKFMDGPAEEATFASMKDMYNTATIASMKVSSIYSTVRFICGMKEFPSMACHC